MNWLYIPIVRHMFRGANIGLQQHSQAVLQSLANQHGFGLHTSREIADVSDTVAVLEHIQELKPEALVLQHVTFATGDLVQPFLEQDLPTVLWALPEAYSTGRLPQNALCGMNMSLSLPCERSLPVRWLYGSVEDITDDFVRCSRAVEAASKVKHAKILQLGGSAPGFFRIASTPEQEMIHLGLPEFMATIPHANPDIPLTESSDYSGEQLEQANRIESALRQAASGYSAVAMRCWPEVPEQQGAMACLACARMADDGIPVACEGDNYGALSMLLAQEVSTQPSILLDLTHKEGDALMFWHCGNGAKAWTQHSHIEKHFNRHIPAVRAMQLKTGTVTGLRLLENHTAFIFTARVVAKDSHFEGVSGWMTDFAISGHSIQAQDVLANILEQRIPHHVAFALGDCSQVLSEACAYLGYRVLPYQQPTGLVQWQ